MRELPKIISVDDHVVEPATVWTDRLPSKYHDVGPRIVRAPVKEITFIGGKFTAVPGEPGDPGEPVDWWFYEDLRRPLIRLDSAVGFDRDDVTLKGITYDDMRPGSFAVKERLEDMDINGVEASLCFPTFPRFCGQTFPEARDKELALLCVQAYNDWMVEEWCGTSGGRLIPLVHRAAVGSELRGRRGAPQRRPRRPRRVLQRDPAEPRAARRSTIATATGCRSSTPATRPAPRSTCTSARGRRCPRPRPTPRPRWAPR